MIWINIDHAESLPIFMAKYPTISRPSPTYNSTNLKSSVLGDFNSNYLAYPPVALMSDLPF